MESQLGSAPQPVAGFARVNLVADPPQLAAPEPVRSAPYPPPPATPAPMLPGAGLIEIALPGGVLVRVDASVDGTQVITITELVIAMHRITHPGISVHKLPVRGDPHTAPPGMEG